MAINWDLISQFGVLFGVVAIILLAKKNKWGFVFGLLQQPFWFITAYINEQWGVFLATMAFTLSFLYGFYEWFFGKKKTKKQLA